MFSSPSSRPRQGSGETVLIAGNKNRVHALSPQRSQGHSDEIDFGGSMNAGVFDVTQLNLIRDAHLDWCAVNSVEPGSVLGEEAVAYLLRAYSAGCDSPEKMIAALDRYISERESHVQLGSAAIPSTGDKLAD
jgi:hypothetical protein